jgi:hypothetical protein
LTETGCLTFQECTVKVYCGFDRPLAEVDKSSSIRQLLGSDLQLICDERNFAEIGKFALDRVKGISVKLRAWRRSADADVTRRELGDVPMPIFPAVSIVTTVALFVLNANEFPSLVPIVAAPPNEFPPFTKAAINVETF